MINSIFLLIAAVKGIRDYENYHYYAVQANPSDTLHIAESLGYTFKGQIGELKDYFLYSVPSQNESTQLIHKRFESHEKVQWVDRQEPRTHLYKRGPVDEINETSNIKKRATTVDEARILLDIKDPGFSEQWHLINSDHTGFDMNVVPVWEKGITGTGVTVAFIDDGLDYEHPDLKDNFSELGSYDYNVHQVLPKPTLLDDTHGTRCAGEVGAAKNDICGLGVAFTSKVAGIRILSGRLTDADEAASVNYAMDTTQIYSCSWGPRDDGRTMEKPPKIVADAVKNGALNGRKGLGSIFVFAAGNGGAYSDNCNFDGYTNDIYTITVAAMDKMQNHPAYSEQCPAILMTAYSSGGRGGPGIYTVDWSAGSAPGGCTNGHGGTSAAAPLAAGIYALVLSSRPDLSWRDVQRLSLENAVIVNSGDADWKKNAAGRLYNHKYGYGGYDALKLVNAAKIFTKVGPQTSMEKLSGPIDTDIPNGDVGVSHSIQITDEDIKSNKLKRLEHVTITVKIDHQRRGDISIHLISPNNFVSRMVEARSRDDNTEGYDEWAMMSVAFWDEPIAGNWTIKVMDTTRLDRVGKFIHWRITLFAESADGTTASPSVPAGTTASPSVPAETTIPSTTLIPKPSSGSGVGGHSSGFSVLAVVSIVMGLDKHQFLTPFQQQPVV